MRARRRRRSRAEPLRSGSLTREHICSTFFQARPGRWLPRARYSFSGMRVFAILVVVVISCATSVMAAEHDAFDAIVRERVSGDGLVDYVAIKEHDAGKLNAYLDQLAGVEVARLP